ncbi:hypothetical protein KFK09_023960 [Dendrobium nobile]|uniref:DUF4005 domain-containing protein n=1 Tax=Dendrobium nobile TaxID=94219 RepID=A0A8T3AHY2_DENNO|nr:hypothetical protein KFK09_023960 [Dendrobium nobile]
MGKSPGKWIKTLLFGKKTARSNSSKGREASKTATQKAVAVEKATTFSGVDSSVTSGPVFISTSSYVVNSEMENRTSEGLDNDELIRESKNPVLEKDVHEFGAPTDPEKMKDLAAIKVQAAFRGYLARRAFGALKGIIRLQALIRGHLVRRQAVVTLHSLLGIIKFQACFRGQRVRSSGIGLEIRAKFPYRKAAVVQKLNSKKKLFTNAFVVRLVSSSITGMPLRTQYVQCEPNSVFSWLERWTASLFWKQTLQGRKITGSKPQAKKNNYAMETESGRSKRGVRRNTTSNIDSGTSVIADHEKPKRTLRKISSSTVDSITENPQSELEKVKRNLRKVSNSMAETLGHVEVESDKLSPNLKNVSNTPSFVPYQSIEGSVEERKHDLILTSETQVDLETESNSIPVGVIVVPCDDPCIDKLHPLQSINGDGNIPILMNGGLDSKEDQTYNENQKSGKRRASFATKSEYEENGIQATPTLPSYMAATESAKAKLRAQTCLKVGSDSVEKNGVTRRHSLPSSNNSKLSSQSPRTQRFAHANGKCVAKNDRTLLSSRDGHEKVAQVEWRR